MKTLTELIHNYQNGIPNSDSEILKRMEPLVKGYASRIHCMEREDSIQELYLTLLKTLPYLSSSSSEGECIRYMQTSVENRYRSLCRSCLSEPEKDDFDSCSVSLQAPDSFDDTYYDVTAYINSYPSDSVQRKILSMYFYLNFQPGIALKASRAGNLHVIGTLNLCFSHTHIMFFRKFKSCL